MSEYDRQIIGAPRDPTTYFVPVYRKVGNDYVFQMFAESKDPSMALKTEIDLGNGIKLPVSHLPQGNIQHSKIYLLKLRKLKHKATTTRE